MMARRGGERLGVLVGVALVGRAVTTTARPYICRSPLAAGRNRRLRTLPPRGGGGAGVVERVRPTRQRHKPPLQSPAPWTTRRRHECIESSCLAVQLPAGCCPRAGRASMPPGISHGQE
jgi:hypothetical protein